MGTIAAYIKDSAKSLRCCHAQLEPHAGQPMWKVSPVCRDGAHLMRVHTMNAESMPDEANVKIRLRPKPYRCSTAIGNSPRERTDAAADVARYY